jgi:hypothetical protein
MCRTICDEFVKVRNFNYPKNVSGLLSIKAIKWKESATISSIGMGKRFKGTYVYTKKTKSYVL